MKMVKNEKLTLQEIEERKKRLEKKKFRTNIKDIFSKAGFTYIKSENIQLSHDIPGLPISEIDAIFICKNIIVIVEDTCSENSKDNHYVIKTVYFSFDNVEEHIKKRAHEQKIYP